MAKFNVSLEGTFIVDMEIEAGSYEEAEEKGREQLDRTIGLDQEDYAVTLAMSEPLSKAV